MKRIFAIMTIILLVALFTVNTFAYRETVSNPMPIDANAAIYTNMRNNSYRIMAEAVPAESILDKYKTEPIISFDAFLTMAVSNRQNGTNLIETYSYFTPDTSDHLFGIFVNNYTKQAQTVNNETKYYYVINFCILPFDKNTYEIVQDEHLYPSNYPASIREDIVYIYGIKDQTDKLPTDFKEIYTIAPLKWGYYDFLQQGTYSEGYTEGYNNGIIVGKQEIDTEQYEKGYQDGVEIGTEEGFSKGYQAGAGESIWQQLIDAVIMTPINSLQNCLNFTILGVNMWTAAKSLFTLVVVVGIIKIITRFI